MTAHAPLRVGKIPYANVYPVYRALGQLLPPGAVEFVEGHPRELNRMLREGRLDISPSSSIEYAGNPGRYLLVPDLSIAARERVMSVLLLSNRPPESLPEGPIALTEASDTSVVLLEILVRQFLRKDNPLVRSPLPAEEALRRFPACLAIGDAAIRASLDRVAPCVTDMAEWWRRETGKPFVFALWIVSRKAVETNGEALRSFVRTLLSAKALARRSIEREADAPIGPDWIPPAFRQAYWDNLSYDLGEAEREGLSLFYALAARAGRIPAAPELAFLPVL
jgi:chorismate dehydratase